MTVRDWSEIRRCIDLRRKDVDDAMSSRDDCAALLRRLSEVSRPSTGAPMVLLLFARMATPACAWLDGGLQVDAVADGDATTFDVLQDLGVGMGERLFPRCRMQAPLAEFASALRRVPEMAGPLEITSDAHRMILRVSTETRQRASQPPHPTAAQSSKLLTPPTPGMAFVVPSLDELLKKRG